MLVNVALLDLKFSLTASVSDRNGLDEASTRFLPNEVLFTLKKKRGWGAKVAKVGQKLMRRFKWFIQK